MVQQGTDYTSLNPRQLGYEPPSRSPEGEKLKALFAVKSIKITISECRYNRQTTFHLGWQTMGNS